MAYGRSAVANEKKRASRIGGTRENSGVFT